MKRNRLFTFKLKFYFHLFPGCGASCIYPLLAVRQNADWHMYATEVNEESINWARENVNRNGLENQITILECSENLVENLNRHTNSFNFTMCNPPFFNDDDPPNEQLKNRTGKRKSANNAKTGIQCELSTAGGEVEFVKEMIEQSAVLKERVKIFTSMLGQKISINKIVNELKSHGIHNFCITEFCQGRTTRWGIAWTLDNCLLLRTVPCIGQSQPKSVIYLELDTSNKKKINEELVDIFENLCDATSRNRMEKITEKQFHFIAFVNSWSNQRRKRREQQRNMQNSKIDDEEPAEKRLKVDPWKQEATLLLHVEVTIQPKDDAFTLCEEILLKYLNGSSGLNGIHELSQFIQNKWNSK